MTAHSGGDVFEHLIGAGRFAGVAAGNVPVEILVAHVGQRLRQARHDAGVEAADGVRAAAGEADECRFLAAQRDDCILHLLKIGKIGLLAGVDGRILVRCAVDADAVTLVQLAGDQIGVADVYDEKVALTLYFARTSSSSEVYLLGPSSKVR